MKSGYELTSLTKIVVQDDINTYAEASGDYTPLHRIPEFAAGTHFGRVVAHGMMILAYVKEMLPDSFGIYWISSGHLKIRFRAPVYPGDKVRTFGRVIKSVEADDTITVICNVGCLNEDDEEVIRGDASITVPRDFEFVR